MILSSSANANTSLKLVMHSIVILQTTMDSNIWKNPRRRRHTVVKDLMPISLTSFLLKTLGRLVSKFLKEGLLTGFRIHEEQYAYQTTGSMDTTRLRLSASWKSSQY